MLYGDLAITSGQGSIVGFDLNKLNDKQIPKLRRKLGVVFQDSLGSLNPKMKIFNILAEPLILRGITNLESIEQKIDIIIKDIKEDKLDNFV